jgi:Cro/C1-type HTH DNA-binding domain
MRLDAETCEVPRHVLDSWDSDRDNDRMGKKRSLPLSDQLRRTMDECGMTRYRIAQETGINESHLSKFYRGERGLSMESLDAIGELLDLEITFRKKPSKQKGK